MNKPSQDEFDHILDLFDNHNKKTRPERRAAVNYLWDAYMMLLFQIGIKLCGFYKVSFESAHLSTRWKQVKEPLSSVDNPDIWKNLIKKLDGLRQGVQHSDDYDPNLKDLQTVRNKAPEFKKWLIKAGQAFYKKNLNFSFKDRFYMECRGVTMEAETLIAKFGDDPYISFKFDNRWNNLEIYKEVMKEKLSNIDKSKDIEYDDLFNLLQLKELIALFNGKEDMLLHLKKCPKCGGNITKSQSHSPHAYDEPPDYVHIRVGCNDCDYELMSESYSI